MTQVEGDLDYLRLGPVRLCIQNGLLDGSIVLFAACLIIVY